MSTPIFEHAEFKQAKDLFESKNEIGAKYVVALVGLPATGKSYISKKLARYLSWSGFKVKVFNVGNRRRNEFKGINQDSHFFDASNATASELRESLAMECLDEAINWLKDGGKIAFLDATNSTIARRASIKERVSKESIIKCFFIESICVDKDLLEANIQLKLQGPDYKDLPTDIALKDFRQRIMNYEKVYTTISEDEEKSGYSYIKIIDVGSKIIANRIKGYLPSQCVFYLMQMHIVKRTIWLSSHGGDG